MKKALILIAFVAGLTMFSPSKGSAQFIVTVRPPAPVVVVARPPRPSPDHIWVEGEWRWNKRARRYVSVPGYWVSPRRGYEWVPGHWLDVRGGSEWIGGHWGRRY